MKPKLRLLTAVALLAASSAYAADFDGSRPLLCATVEAHDCAAAEDCVKDVPTEMGLPQFFRIDFAGQAVVGPERTSPIKLREETDGQMLLQGTELGFGWTIALDKTNGKVAVSLVSRIATFVVFGACTVP